MEFVHPKAGKNQDGAFPPLPHSKEAEGAMLAAILLDSAKAAEVLDSLEPSDFFLPFHRVYSRQFL
jgi:hypothetical protein